MTVWAGIQAPFMVRAQVAQALGLPSRKVRIIAQYLGGAFGGKTLAPQAVEAARLARITGRPAQGVRDRREEFFLDTFRPAAVVKVRGGLGPDGRLAFWGHRVYGTSKAEADIGCVVPAKQILGVADFSGPAGLHPFGTGAWRAPAANTNVFARESFMDILAALGEGLRFQGGRILDENSDTCTIPRFSWLPAIETVLVPNPDFPSQGGGEAPIVCMGAVLANAVFDAVGARVYELPMLPMWVLAAMGKTI
jgi:CO/xanthine dehydrogenase Mo-binding subunit